MTHRNPISYMAIAGLALVGIYASILVAFSGALTSAQLDQARATTVEFATNAFVREDVPRAGSFVGTDEFTISGEAVVLSTDGSAQRTLRFTEDFRTDRSSRVEVVLRAENGNIVSLGDLQLAIGRQQYEIPETVDLSVFNQVQIWDFRANQSFGSATLNSVD